MPLVCVVRRGRRNGLCLLSKLLSCSTSRMTATVHPLLNTRQRVQMECGGYFIGGRPRNDRRGAGSGFFRCVLMS